ncbi:MAG: hypothetical protein U5K30_02045 [Acidimicrobiales bacterium]|nr:hypothetical protein [Acidimicrobiales bacterium]
MAKGEMLAEERAAIEEADIVLINGEGSIYDRQRKGRMLLLIAYTAATRLGKPTALVNHTADLNDPGVRSIAAQTYPVLSHVVSREPTTSDSIRQLSDVAVTDAADAAFMWSPLSQDRFVPIAANGIPRRLARHRPLRSRPTVCLHRRQFDLPTTRSATV